ncbi:hypothetical protein [Streptomyces sp. SM10]|uniref:hypothetical protein n=1 Tax=Streptomyces sp. SM10 TaxID=565556 RepID=UPI0011B001C6|nr:hypothetical protein [Streptomyces sp. SM10]
MRNYDSETRGNNVSDDAVQLAGRIRFALGILGESNSHHEFEALCLGLARRRITSNLLSATGPVAGGGDQGRDAESHWSDIPRERCPTSLFASLASAQKVVMACTIQSTDIPGKIRKDLASICGQGKPVDRVIYFTVTAVPDQEAARPHRRSRPHAPGRPGHLGRRRPHPPPRRLRPVLPRRPVPPPANP